METERLYRILDVLYDVCDTCDSTGFGVSNPSDDTQTTKEFLRIDLCQFLVYVGNKNDNFTAGELALLNIVLGTDFPSHVMEKFVISTLNDAKPHVPLSLISLIQFGQQYNEEGSDEGLLSQIAHFYITIFDGLGEIMVILDDTPAARARKKEYMAVIESYARDGIEQTPQKAEELFEDANDEVSSPTAVKTYELNEKISFELPSGFFVSREENDEGKISVSISTGEYENDDGETGYKFSCRASCSAYNQESHLSEGNENIFSDKVPETVSPKNENIKQIEISRNPHTIAHIMPLPFSFLGRVTNIFTMFVFVETGDGSIFMLNFGGQLNEDEPDVHFALFENISKVMKALRVNGVGLPLENITPEYLKKTIELTFSDANDEASSPADVEVEKDSSLADGETIELFDQISFELSAGFIVSPEKDYKGDEIGVLLQSGEYLDDDGEIHHEFTCSVRPISVSATNTTTNTTAEPKIDDVLTAYLEATITKKFLTNNLRQTTLSGTPLTLVRTIEMKPVDVGFDINNWFSLTALVKIEEGYFCFLDTSEGFFDDPDEDLFIYERMFEVMKALRVNGEKLPLDGVSPEYLKETIQLTFDEDNDEDDISSDMKISAVKAVELDETCLAAAGVGDTVIFGRYEQASNSLIKRDKEDYFTFLRDAYDNNPSDGAEGIKWLVLAKEDNRILVISQDALDCKPRNLGSGNHTWENCELRRWFSYSFIKKAFTRDQQARILAVNLTNPKNPKWDTPGGKRTKDKVFLLSIEEAEKYFPSDSARQAKASAYAEAKGAETDKKGWSCWWLRSSGYVEGFSSYVDYDGAINYYGTFENSFDNCVRPALWLDTSNAKDSDKADAKSNELGENKDSRKIPVKIEEVTLANTEVGSLVTFGSYEQDNDPTNGAEAITWQVLAKEENRVLVISQDALNSKPFDERTGSSVTWQTSSLRQWLNDDFLKEAFSPEQQAKIPAVNLTNPKNPNWDVPSGNDTTDKVFLLSIDEALQYFSPASARVANTSAFARAQEAHKDDKRSSWWLRTMGSNGRSAVCVNRYGSVSRMGDDVTKGNNTVRPALWIEISNLNKLDKTDTKFTEPGENKDSRKIPVKIEEVTLANTEVGCLVTFGSYEQDNDPTNGAEAITWQVLAKEENRVLVISQDALNTNEYHERVESVTWETSTLRRWLNDDFLKQAFSPKQQAKIPAITLTNSNNPKFNTPGGKDTTDQVFLLSIEEAEKYFSSDSARKAKASAYAEAKNAKTDKGGWSCWWLRSQGNRDIHAARVFLDGSVDHVGDWVVSRSISVRPALWIEIIETKETKQKPENEPQTTTKSKLKTAVKKSTAAAKEESMAPAHISGIVAKKTTVTAKENSKTNWVIKGTKLITCEPDQGETEVVIPDGVTSIGDSAFKNCINLKSITIPETVKSIGKSAFYGCKKLQNITLPNQLTSLGNSAFYGCKKLQTIILPNQLTSIGNSTFKTCRNLTNISIPDTVIKIGNSAFFGCKKLQNIALPKRLTSVDVSIFNGCTMLKSITIPDSVTSINDRAFSSCENLQVVTIPDRVTSIGESAFSECKALNSIIIPESVTSIGEGAFHDCKSLQSIIVPDGVTEIMGSTFSGCISLISITIPDSVTSINDRAFRSCENLQVVTIPDSVTSIGESAFFGCKVLKSITIPDGVTSIGKSSFWGCENLLNITIPDGVTSIGEGAFGYCKNLQSFTIPDVVTSIGERVFENCVSLQSITIPNGVTSIGGSAFWGCDNLQSITIPDGVTSIGEHAFLGCNSLKHVVFGGEIPDNAENLFPYDAVLSSREMNDTKDRASNSSQHSNAVLSKHVVNDTNERASNSSQQSSSPVYIVSDASSNSNSQQTQPTTKQGCYIATAVYGSYEAPEVITLRRYRDETLMSSKYGRCFIRTYYQLSPSIAEKLKNAKHINRLVRSILNKWVTMLDCQRRAKIDHASRVKNDHPRPV